MFNPPTSRPPVLRADGSLGGLRQDKPVPSHRKTSVWLEVGGQAWQAGSAVAAAHVGGWGAGWGPQVGW